MPGRQTDTNTTEPPAQRVLPNQRAEPAQVQPWAAAAGSLVNGYTTGVRSCMPDCPGWISNHYGRLNQTVQWPSWKSRLKHGPVSWRIFGEVSKHASCVDQSHSRRSVPAVLEIGILERKQLIDLSRAVLAVLTIIHVRRDIRKSAQGRRFIIEGLISIAATWYSS